MTKIADGDSWTMPPAVEDPAAFDEVEKAFSKR
jgi:hypothetical protein